MAKCDTLVLDKTGTITKKGKPEVVEHLYLQNFDHSLLYALVSSSTHPISQGIVRFLQDSGTTLTLKQLEHIKTVEAKGVKAF